MLCLKAKQIFLYVAATLNIPSFVLLLKSVENFEVAKSLGLDFKR